MDRQQVIQTLRAAKPVLAERYGVTRLALFGSTVRGDSRPDSDVDIVVGFDGSPDVVESIKAGDVNATVLQPAWYIAELAVEQAHQYLTTGSTGQPEKQSIDCVLVTPDNAHKFDMFREKE